MSNGTLCLMCASLSTEIVQERSSGSCRARNLAFSVILFSFLSPTTASAQNVYDCADFASQDHAQEILIADPSDPNFLDLDGDGLACDLGVLDPGETVHDSGALDGSQGDLSNDELKELIERGLEQTGFINGPDSVPNAARHIETDDAGGCDEVGWSLDATRGQPGRPGYLSGSEAWKYRACEMGIELTANCSHPFMATGGGIGESELVVVCAVMVSSGPIGATMLPQDFRLVPADNRQIWLPDEAVWAFLNDYTHNDAPLSLSSPLFPNDTRSEYFSFIIPSDELFVGDTPPLRLMYSPWTLFGEASNTDGVTSLVPIEGDIALWMILEETTPVDVPWAN